MATASVEQDPKALEIESFIAQANEARKEYVGAARQYRNWAHLEAQLEAERPGLLVEIKARLMADASLAATNAEKLAHSDLQYLAHLEKQRDTVRDKDDARTQMVSAKLRCQTALAAIRSLAGLI